MLHFGLFDIRTDIFVLFLSIVVVLFQLLLCFKAKKKTIRLIPVYLSSGVTIILTTLGLIFDGWDALGFFFLAICSAILLFFSGVGWGIWAIVRRMGR